MEARNRNVKDWLTKVRTRQIALPRFQRFEAWGPSFVADLFTNVIRGLPIGSTLVLGVGDKPQFVSREIVGAPKEGERINELLLDGQQRLTSLWRSLNESYPDKTYLVCFPGDDEEDNEPYVYAETRWLKNGKKYPLWVDIPKNCWDSMRIPVRLLNPDEELEYKEWAKRASDNNKDIEIEIRDKIAALRAKVANFQLPFLYLEPTTSKPVAIDVFVKLNTRFVKLTAFDIVVAQVEEATGTSLHDLVDSLKGNVPEVANYIEPSEIVLPVFALLQDRLPNQRGYTDLEFERIVDEWPKIVVGTKGLIDFLVEERVVDGDRLPTESVIAPLAALWAESSDSPDERGNVRILLRKYLWRVFFTTRYDRAIPTAVLQDYRVLRKVIKGQAGSIDIPCFDETKYPLADKEVLMQARWPKYRDRLARAILLLSFRGGAEDISDGASLSINNIKTREYHHLYPVAWLRDNAFDEETAYHALNCVLVTWRTNRKILAKEPVQYLKEICDASTLGEGEIRRRLHTHFVDFELLAKGDYKEFLSNRAQSLENAITALSNGLVWRP